MPIGLVHLASVTVPGYATMPQVANASFSDVNHAGAGVPGKEGLGACGRACMCVAPHRACAGPPRLLIPSSRTHAHTHPYASKTGTQLVKEVVNNQVSPLGLAASVPARAYIFGKTALPPVPVVLHLQCLFLNHWGSDEPNASECYTHLHPFYTKLYRT